MFGRYQLDSALPVAERCQFVDISVSSTQWGGGAASSPVGRLLYLVAARPILPAARLRRQGKMSAEMALFRLFFFCSQAHADARVIAREQS